MSRNGDNGALPAGGPLGALIDSPPPSDEYGVVARIEALEIVNRGVGVRALASELSYWQQRGPERGYEVTQGTVRDWPVWWIGGGVAEVEMVWVDVGERVYRFRLHCRGEVREESERVLQQMLSTLETTAINWNRMGIPGSHNSRLGIRDADGDSRHTGGVGGWVVSPARVSVLAEEQRGKHRRRSWQCEFDWRADVDALRDALRALLPPQCDLG